MQGYEGDTVGSALYAAGLRTFSRSFKYHRNRGLLCCTGHCPNCMMSVDGVPNVRVCVEPLREGAHVQAQNVWGNPRSRRPERHGQVRRAVHAGRLLLPHDDPPAAVLAALREGSPQPRGARPRRRAGRALPALRRRAPARARARHRRRAGRPRGCARGGDAGAGSRARGRGQAPSRGGARRVSRCSRLLGRSGSGRGPRPGRLRDRALPLPRRARSSSPPERSSSRSCSQATISSGSCCRARFAGSRAISRPARTARGRRRGGRSRPRGRRRPAGGRSRGRARRRSPRHAGAAARSPAPARPGACASRRRRGDRMRSHRRVGRPSARLLAPCASGRACRVRPSARSVRPDRAAAGRRGGGEGDGRGTREDRRSAPTTRAAASASCAYART